MATYLLTWNPAKHLKDIFQENIRQIRETGEYVTDWSVGNTQRIKKGDRVFLMRQGPDTPGIFGSGIVIEPARERPHWDVEKKKKGKKDWGVWVRFETILDATRDTILPRGELKHGILSKVHWDTQRSGILIPLDVAQELEKLWAQLTGESQFSPRITEQILDPDEPPTAAARKVSTVIRIIRDTKKAQAIKNQYSYHCQICDIRLETPGGPYAEAAHIKPLGKPHNGPDHKSNLICLCPNHHVLFDSGGISINDDLTLNGYSGVLKHKSPHKLNPDYLRYHRKNTSQE